MGRKVDRETVVNWRCDLCGNEEIVTGGYHVDTEKLPPDWCAVIMIPNGKMVGWYSHVSPHAPSSDPGEWRLTTIPREKVTDVTPPGDISLLCPFCRKSWQRLVADTKARMAKPPATSMPSAGMPRPTAGQLRGAVPRSGCLLAMLASLFSPRRRQ